MRLERGNLQKIRFTSRLPYFVLLAAIIFYIYLSTKIGLGLYDGGPDEGMRAKLPTCMLQGNWLPSGYDKCTVYELGNWSYAFYPQVLGSYVSAVFMVIARTIGFNASETYMAGRLASVVFSGIVLIFCAKTVELIFHRKRNKQVFSALAIIILGFWPQFAFLSSYMNNDIVALAGVSILIYALTSGVVFKWNYKNSLILALGIVVSGLGYWNAYGFIAVAVIIFLITAYRQNRTKKTGGLKLIATAAIPSALFTLPFFVLNLVRYHDLLGMDTFKKQYMLWLAEGGQVLQHPWIGTTRSLLLKTNYVYDSLQSFIGNIGYRSIPLPFLFSLMYLGLIFVGFGWFTSSGKIYWRRRDFWLLTTSVLASSTITILLSLYYSLRVDVQPQGRYVIYLLLPIVLMIVTGFGNSFIFESRFSRILLVIVALCYIMLCIGYFVHSIYIYSWSGVNLHV